MFVVFHLPVFCAFFTLGRLDAEGSGGLMKPHRSAPVAWGIGRPNRGTMNPSVPSPAWKSSSSLLWEVGIGKWRFACLAKTSGCVGG